MRPTARSGSIVASIPHELADELHEARRDPDQQEHQVEKMRAEGLVEQVPDDVADEGRGGEQERERGVLAHHRHDRFLFLHSLEAANWAASCTSNPILGWLGSKSTRIPYSSSASLVVGPIEATSILENPARTCSSMPSSAAMRNRCATWIEVV